MKTVSKIIKVGIDLANANTEKGEEREVELLANEYENLDEFVQECGGADKGLIVINRIKTRNAFQAAVNKYNYQAPKIPAGDENAYTELTDKTIQGIALNYKFDVSDGLSAKDLKDSALAMKDKFMKMSAEEKQAMSAEDVLRSLGLLN